MVISVQNAAKGGFGLEKPITSYCSPPVWNGDLRCSALLGSAHLGSSAQPDSTELGPPWLGWARLGSSRLCQAWLNSAQLRSAWVDATHRGPPQLDWTRLLLSWARVDCSCSTGHRFGLAGLVLTARLASAQLDLTQLVSIRTGLARLVRARTCNGI